MVEIALFNINDISLLFSGFHALVLACLLFFSQQQGRIKQVYWQFLALFFLLGALRTFDTLVYWNINVRDTLSLVSANFFFLFGFAFFLQGPLLFWFTRAAIFRDFALTRRDTLHLVPAVCYPLYIYQIFQQLTPEQKFMQQMFASVSSYLPASLSQSSMLEQMLQQWTSSLKTLTSFDDPNNVYIYCDTCNMMN